MQTATEYPVSDIDPFDEGFLAEPHAAHRELRELGAAVRFSRYDAWGVAGFEHVHAALNDAEAFCSSAGVGLSDFRKEKPWRPPSLLLEADAPEHTRARHVITRVLSPVTIRTMREAFVAAANEMFDALGDRVEVDGMKELAEVFPPKVFGDVIGLPAEGRDNLAAYGNMVFNAFGPRNRLFEESVRAMDSVLPWIARHCERDALAPGGLGAKIHDAAEAEGLTAAQGALLVRSLLTAGVDTTVQSTGAALLCLAANQDQYAALRANPKLARTAFEEAIRLVSPVQTFFRTTTREVMIGDVLIPKDEKVLLFLAGANRDPAEWPDPDRYDISRRAAGHVGFGSGPHACVGQMVARLEGEVVLTELVRRYDRAELAGTPVVRLNNTLRSLESLPLRLHRADG
jgi:4-methoxybenzoate monooxygenase (O-demethylating)